MNDYDIKFAHEKERRIKLVAHVEKLESGEIIMSVMPHLISRNKYIYSVEDEFNGVVIKGQFYYKQFMFGRGAGGHPTGSAVLSDITACLYDYKYEYKKLNSDHKVKHTNNHDVRIYLRYSTDSDLALFSFKEIYERYDSRDNKYVVGLISLVDLLRINEEIRHRKLFLSVFPYD